MTTTSVVNRMEEIEIDTYSEHVFEKYEYNGYIIEIIRDNDAESPREWDNLGTMICWHRDYNLGDRQIASYEYDSVSEIIKEIEETEGPIAIIKSLYLYDHSGISMSTDGNRFYASDPQGWDWGVVGFIYISKAKIREEYNVKRINKKLLARVDTYLTNEVQTYDDYLTGNVYGYVVKDQSDEIIDSCWGYYPEHSILRGKHELEYMLSEAQEVIDREIEREVKALMIEER